MCNEKLFEPRPELVRNLQSALSRALGRPCLTDCPRGRDEAASCTKSFGLQIRALKAGVEGPARGRNAFATCEAWRGRVAH